MWEIHDLPRKKPILFCFLILFLGFIIPDTTLAQESTESKIKYPTIEPIIKAGIALYSTIPGWETGFLPDFTGLGAEGALSDTIEYRITINPAYIGNFLEEKESLLKDLYFDFRFFDTLSFTVGQFTVPFGEEADMDVVERPGIAHFSTTEEITPGRDRGIMLYGKADFFRYSLGVFNGSGISTQLLDLNDTFTTAKAVFSFGKDLRFRFGGNALYRFNDAPNFADGFFANIRWKPDHENVVTLTGEYIEEMHLPIGPGDLLFSRNGIMASLGWRFGDLNPCVYFENYDALLNTTNVEDRLAFGLAFTIFMLDETLILKAANVFFFKGTGAMGDSFSILLSYNP